ncbi:MAG: hypothetical protein KAT77_00605 [Nanoarchaeota archaeon]|nr:hypothetical protein [Nanoarchaeota archaeon]
MAFGVMEILGIIGLIIGIIVAVRLKKLDVMELLTGWGIFVLFGPAVGVITDLFAISGIVVISYIVALVSFFGLGVAIWVLIKKFMGLFQ